MALIALVASAGDHDDSSSTAGVLAALAPSPDGLSFDDVIERAIETAPSIDVARAEHEKARTEKDFAWLPFAPRLDVSGVYNRLSRINPAVLTAAPPGGEQGSDFTFPVFLDSYTIQARLSAPVTDYFLTTIHEFNSVLTVEEVRRAQLSAQRRETALQAIEAFIDLIRARAFEVVAKASVGVLERQLADGAVRQDIGVGTRGDFLETRAQLAMVRVAAVRAQGDVRVREATLMRILHADGAVKLRHREDLFAADAATIPTTEAAVSEAMRSRSDLKALESRIRQREDDVLARRGALFPRLEVGLSLLTARPNPRFFYIGTVDMPASVRFETTWQLDVMVGWSPNGFLAGYSDLLQARQDVASARANLVALKDAIAIEVSEAVNVLRAVKEAIGASQEAVEAAEAAFADRQHLMAARSGTTRELLESEEALRRAQLQIINAHLDMRLARARLDRALGRLVDEEGVIK